MHQQSAASGRWTSLKEAVTGSGNLRTTLLVMGLVLLLTHDLRQSVQLQRANRQSGKEHDFWLLSREDTPHQVRIDAFRRLLAGGNKEWRAAILCGVNLEDAFLPEADLQGADLSFSKLSRATLAGAKLSKVRLQFADLTESDLSRAHLAGTELLKSRLTHAKLYRANLRGAFMQGVEAQSASFEAADLGEAQLWMADLADTNFTGADLSGVNLEASSLRRANLFLTRLTGANLKETDFTDSNWWRARGLSAEQLALLKQKFPPTEKSDPLLRENYAAWLDGH